MSETQRRFSATAGTGGICCPFFVAHGKNEILCEGIVPGSRSCVMWRNANEREFHERTYCENQYRRCEQYCSIMHWRWEED